MVFGTFNGCSSSRMLKNKLYCSEKQIIRKKKKINEKI